MTVAKDNLEKKEEELNNKNINTSINKEKINS